MIAVIDYKAGNLTSVVKALAYLGAQDIRITQDPADVLRASKIVLPGVGHFQSTQLLTDLGLTQATREAVANGIPFLGICVGLQWLYAGSTEAPDTPAATLYGGPFTGAVERANVMGVQFHPEKSGATGLQVLSNFLEWKPC